MSQEPSRPWSGRIGGVAAVGNGLVRSLRAAAFWLAVLLPLAYPPALFHLGDHRLLFGLLALHVVALSFGHGHGSG